jgi:aspartate aminotransferase-like enzyme
MAQNLRLPGPTPLPPSVQAAVGQDMINQRGPEFAAILRDLCARTPALHKTTEGDVLFFPSCGTGGLEASIVNLFSAGDTVISASIGYFGERSSKIAQAFGLKVVECGVAWGEAASPEVVRQALLDHPEAKAVLTTHNETSTGVTNDIRALGRVCAERGVLFVVDAVSSMVALPLFMDEWGCDLVISGSQKAWMCPPGVAIVAVGPRAWAAHRRATLPRYYWDFTLTKEAHAKGFSPATPALSVMFGLQAAVQLIEAEGLEQVWERHARIGALVRRRVGEMGLRVFGDADHVSDTVTAIELPPGIAPGDVLERLRVEHDVILAGGQGVIADRIVRFGHLGWVHEPEVNAALDALATTLGDLGYALPASAAPAAVSAD